MDLFDDFLAGYSGNTARAYRRDLVDWEAWLASSATEMLAASRADVNGYARSLEDRSLSAATVARKLSAVSGLYSYACAEGLLARNPVEHVRRPRVSQDSQTVGLSQEEAVALLAAAKADSDARSLPLVLVLLHTGARIGEALRLQVTDVEIDGGVRVVRLHGKGGKIRVIPIPGIATALDALIGERTSGPVFITRTGATWAQSQAFRKVQQLARAAGLEQADRVTPHSLRHTSITAALDAGATIHDTQDFAGHADPRTTQRYNRARHNLANSPAHKLAGYFGSAA